MRSSLADFEFCFVTLIVIIVEMLTVYSFLWNDLKLVRI